MKCGLVKRTSKLHKWNREKRKPRDILDGKVRKARQEILTLR